MLVMEIQYYKHKSTYQEGHWTYSPTKFIIDQYDTLVQFNESR